MILEKAPYLNHFNTILESLFLHYNLLKTPCGTIILQQFDSGSYLICSAMCVVQNKNFVLYKFTYPGMSPYVPIQLSKLQRTLLDL